MKGKISSQKKRKKRKKRNISGHENSQGWNRERETFSKIV
jgi:hypothetical protein